MTPQSANSSSINSSARCSHRFPNGMRCRLFASATQPYCPKHTQPVLIPPPNPAEIASTLTANLDDFTSAVQINDFLSRLLLLLAQDKIATRRAAVLAYITNQLLRTLPAIAKEVDAEPVQVIFDMPGPDRTSPHENPSQQTNTPNKEAVPA